MSRAVDFAPRPLARRVTAEAESQRADSKSAGSTGGFSTALAAVIAATPTDAAPIETVRPRPRPITLDETEPPDADESGELSETLEDFPYAAPIPLGPTEPVPAPAILKTLPTIPPGAPVRDLEGLTPTEPGELPLSMFEPEQTAVLGKANGEPSPPAPAPATASTAATATAPEAAAAPEAASAPAPEAASAPAPATASATAPATAEPAPPHDAPSEPASSDAIATSSHASAPEDSEAHADTSAQEQHPDGGDTLEIEAETSDFEAGAEPATSELEPAGEPPALTTTASSVPRKDAPRIDAPPAPPPASPDDAEMPEGMKWSLLRDAAGQEHARVTLEHPTLGTLKMDFALMQDGVDVRVLVPSLYGALRLERDERRIRELLEERGARLAALRVSLDGQREPAPARSTRPRRAGTGRLLMEA